MSPRTCKLRWAWNLCFSPESLILNFLRIQSFDRIEESEETCKFGFKRSFVRGYICRGPTELSLQMSDRAGPSCFVRSKCLGSLQRTQDKGRMYSKETPNSDHIVPRAWYNQIVGNALAADNECHPGAIPSMEMRKMGYTSEVMEIFSMTPTDYDENSRNLATHDFEWQELEN